MTSNSEYEDGEEEGLDSDGDMSKDEKTDGMFNETQESKINRTPVTRERMKGGADFDVTDGENKATDGDNEEPLSSDDSRCRIPDCDLWKFYSRMYVKGVKKSEKGDLFERRKPAEIPKFPRVASDEKLIHPPKCLPPLTGEERTNQLPTKLCRESLIWDSMRRPMDERKPCNKCQSSEELELDEIWPERWPCREAGTYERQKILEKLAKPKRKDLYPCDSDSDTNTDPTFDDTQREFATSKELGHARVTPMCPVSRIHLLIDRCTGDNPGLVDGDYTLHVEFRNDRTYAMACLHGLKGMHLPELAKSRGRRNTWKFCLFQALVALLAKTQIKYKYARSSNIDYIYDHAWMLFTHIGMINAINKNPNQRFDDIVVYNYKFSVELQLLEVTHKKPIVEGADFAFSGSDFIAKSVMERPELSDTKLPLDIERTKHAKDFYVHEGTKDFEEWFESVPSRFTNCILRTNRFSLAFWKDVNFWYLYNPYRCDEYGFWDDEGHACIVKFCSKLSLRRHITILVVRAYVYQPPIIEEPPLENSEEFQDSNQTNNDHISDDQTNNYRVKFDPNIKSEENSDNDDISQSVNDQSNIAYSQLTQPLKESEKVENPEDFIAQLFSLNYHCCKVHNLRLLERRATRRKIKTIEGDQERIDACPVYFDNMIERGEWLKQYSVTWSTVATIGKKEKAEGQASKGRWHQYMVEESNKLFSLWGDVHVTDPMFERENRGMQGYACYVVCAGMTRMTAPEYWTPRTLDVIVMCGDRYHTYSKQEAQVKFEHRNIRPDNYLSRHFKIGETLFEASVLPAICGKLYSRSSKCLYRTIRQMFLTYKFGILTCEGRCVGVFKYCGAYYVCDVNSYGPPLFPNGVGAAYLLRVTYFSLLIRVLVLTIGTAESCPFAVNPIEILKVIEVGKSDLGHREICNKKSTRTSR